MWSRKFPLIFVIALLTATAFAQRTQPPPLSRATQPSPAVTDEFIQKQFGDNCSLLPGPPQFVADLDGDGAEDLLVVAKCRNPLADRYEYGFMVADPYDSFLGFGDVKVTSTFASDEPERRGLSLLIIEGTQSEGWRTDRPKAKFMLINLPFKSIAVKRFSTRKRTTLGVYMEETGEGENTTSVLFWDGKKYRYAQLGSSLE
jgi:hypothetical protein